jgi:hypothetical protein
MTILLKEFSKPTRTMVPLIEAAPVSGDLPQGQT